MVFGKVDGCSSLDGFVVYRKCPRSLFEENIKNKKMIQTSYVPLEHPYQIIEHHGFLGIQIGTLIVTVDKTDESESGYSIETHSHPVVSYVNNKIHTDMKFHRSLSLPRPYEGVVWDKVELHELRTLVREGEQLSWAGFMDYCRRQRIAEIDGEKMNVDAFIMDNFGMLLDWGIEIGFPEFSQDKELLIEVDGIIQYGDKKYLMTEGGMGIVVGYNNKHTMMRQIFAQVDYYLSLMKFFGITHSCDVKFWTQDLFVQGITSELNERWSALQHDKFSYSQDDEESDTLWAAEDIVPPLQDK